jgi:hypothetical protein
MLGMEKNFEDSIMLSQYIAKTKVHFKGVDLLPAVLKKKFRTPRK